MKIKTREKTPQDKMLHAIKLLTMALCEQGKTVSYSIELSAPSNDITIRFDATTNPNALIHF